MPTKDVVRTTLTIPRELFARIDKLAAESSGVSRNDFLVEAIQRDLRRREREAIDAAFLAAFAEGGYSEDADLIMREFAGADSEAARAFDEEYGPYQRDRA
jgi:metal-responsive CopG/Arc/MetJ family transcriptional regulator